MNNKLTHLAESIQITRVELIVIRYLAQIAESLAQNHSSGCLLSGPVALAVTKCADRIEHIAQYALELDVATRVQYLASDLEFMRNLLFKYAQDFHSMSSLPTIDNLNDLTCEFDANDRLNKSTEATTSEQRQTSLRESAG